MVDKKEELQFMYDWITTIRSYMKSLYPSIKEEVEGSDPIKDAYDALLVKYYSERFLNEYLSDISIVEENREQLEKIMVTYADGNSLTNY